MRPLEIKTKRKGFVDAAVEFDLTRQERSAAMAAYMAFPRTPLIQLDQDTVN
jgi:hypothetical protein